MSEQSEEVIGVRHISADIHVTVTEPTLLELQIASQGNPSERRGENLAISLDGQPVNFAEISSSSFRIHHWRSGCGEVAISYQATITGQTAPQPAQPADSLLYVRPSRYAPCDKLYGFVAQHFPGKLSPIEKVFSVQDFVASSLSYRPTSTASDGALETLVTGSGVCRDYAHLSIALLRALGIPARFVSVYAPGCTPMDFHAVVEVLLDGQWWLIDATGLAPRQSMLRIATGRDAADCAFLSNHGGRLRLNSIAVQANMEVLPIDNAQQLVALG